MKWLPIESAPKDGTKVLLWSDDEDSAEPVGYAVAWWSDGKWIREGDDFNLVVFDAAHWAALPAPPHS